MTAFPSITAVTFDFASAQDPLGTGWDGNTPTGNTTNLLKSSGGVGSKNQPSGTGFGSQVISATVGPDMEAWVQLPTVTATNGQEIAAWFVRCQQDGAATLDCYTIAATLASGADTWEIDRVVNNSATTLTTTGTQNIAAGDYFGAKVEDSGGNPVISGYWCAAANDPTNTANWTQVITTTDSNAAKITGTGKIAFEIQGIVTTFDDMRAGTIVTGGGGSSATPPAIVVPNTAVMRASGWW